MRYEMFWLALALVPCVSGQTAARELRLPGEFQPVESVDLRAPFPGFVAQVLVGAGALVKKGDALVLMSSPENASRQDYTQSQSRVQPSQDTQQAFAQAEAAVRAAGGFSQPSSASQDDTKVTAPFDGVVRQVWAQPGSLAGPSFDPLLRLESAQLKMIVHVPKAGANGIAKGAQMRFTIPDRPAASGPSTAVVTRVAPGSAKTIDVELAVDNAQGSFAPGMHPEVSWPSVAAKSPPGPASRKGAAR